MATNKVQEGKVLSLAIADKSAGDPVIFGNITGVALTDTDASGNVQVATEGVFSLTVKGADESGADALVAGEKVYYDGGDINGDSANGTLFGKVLAAVDAGASPTRSVLLIQA